MTAVDPELLRLLLQELERHLVTLDARGVDRAAAQRAVHALKGSAGLAGERDLASALERLHRRVRDGDDAALTEATEIVRTAVARMRVGESPVATRWPVPPDDLLATALDPLVRTQYAAEVTDRLARIDEALGSIGDPAEAAAVVYRHVHTMKGAASAVGDEPMSWFCHGLEERLKGARGRVEAAAALEETTRWRAVLGALLDDPEGALRMLRATGAPRPPTSQPPRPSARPIDEDAPRSFPPSGDEATIRVSALSVDRLIDRVEAIDLVRERVTARSDAAREVSRTVRELRGKLVEALRLIGPPRPWGAPAAALRRIEDVVSALGPIGEEIEGAAGGLRGAGLSLKDGVTEAKKQLSAMRQTPVGRIFARLGTAIEAEARRMDRAVIVRTRGADETIDRRVAEQLVEPCLQLVRNAVAHGIESPEARAAARKPPSGTISLAARKIGSRLSIAIQDDGAGVDVADVRRRAIASGVVTKELADAADDETLLTLLFLPGFSTRDSSDLLAGRGIGLDIARGAIQRLGGAVHLSSRVGVGFSARIDVPIEGGLASILWVTAAGEEYAVPVASTLGVRLNDGPHADRVPHLAACIEPHPAEPARFTLALDVHGEAGDAGALVVGVDRVGRVEELLVRPLTPLVAGLGPFAGAIARGDGSLRLAIDTQAIAPRARAIARGFGSEAPSSRRPQA